MQCITIALYSRYIVYNIQYTMYTIYSIQYTMYTLDNVLLLHYTVLYTLQCIDYIMKKMLCF